MSDESYLKNTLLHNFVLIVRETEVDLKAAFVTVRDEGVLNKRESERERGSLSSSSITGGSHASSPQQPTHQIARKCKR